METREFWEVFHRCLSKLPSSLADAFFLREVDGLARRRCSNCWESVPRTCRARLYRARTLLRRCLEIGWFGRRPSAARVKEKRM